MQVAQAVVADPEAAAREQAGKLLLWAANEEVERARKLVGNLPKVER